MACQEEMWISWVKNMFFSFQLLDLFASLNDPTPSWTADGEQHTMKTEVWLQWLTLSSHSPGEHLEVPHWSQWCLRSLSHQDNPETKMATWARLCTNYREVIHTAVWMDTIGPCGPCSPLSPLSPCVINRYLTLLELQILTKISNDCWFMYHYSRESVQASLSLFSHAWLTLAQCSTNFNVNAWKVKINVIIDKITNLFSWCTLWSWIAWLTFFSLSFYISHEVRVKSGLTWYKNDRWAVSLKAWISAKLNEVFITLPASQAILVTPKRDGGEMREQ